MPTSTPKKPLAKVITSRLFFLCLGLFMAIATVNVKAAFTIPCSSSLLTCFGNSIAGDSLTQDVWNDFTSFISGTWDRGSTTFNVYTDKDVGIGSNNNPTQSLEINDTGLGSVARVLIEDEDGGHNPELQLKYGVGANDHWAFYGNDAGDLNIWSTDNKLTINQTGNVTIPALVSCDTIDTNANGVLSCGSDADTNTNAETICADDTFLNGDGTCDSLSTGSHTTDTTLSNENVDGFASDNVTTGYIPRDTGTVTGFENSPIYATSSSGNVGIGTGTTAGSKLEIKGTTFDNSASSLEIKDSNNNSLFFVRNDGKVGFGTADPGNIPGSLFGHRIEIANQDGINSDILYRVAGNTTNSFASLDFVRSRGTLAAPTLVSNGDQLSQINFGGHDGAGGFRIASSIRSFVDGVTGANDMPGRLLFFTTPDGSATITERMRLNSAGNLGIGTTPSWGRLHVLGFQTHDSGDSVNFPLSFKAGETWSTSIYARNSRGNNYGDMGIAGIATGALGTGIYGEGPIGLIAKGSNKAAIFQGDVDISGNVAITGTLTYGIDGGATSDLRLKKNIFTLNNSLEKILKLRGVKFDWKDNKKADKNKISEHEIGLIAQEVEKVLPEVVRIDDDGYRRIVYSQFPAVLIEAIKEQQKQIQDLKDLVCLDHSLSEICLN